MRYLPPDDDHHDRGVDDHHDRTIDHYHHGWVDDHYHRGWVNDHYHRGWVDHHDGTARDDIDDRGADHDDHGTRGGADLHRLVPSPPIARS
jgi:hypothetical protein